MRIERAAADALICYFGDRIDEELNRRVMALYERLLSQRPAGILGLVPSYASLLLRYDPLAWSEEELGAHLSRLAADPGDGPAEEEAEALVIPVWYDPEVGWDLERVASMHSIGIPELIELHSRRLYRVYAVGFMPGFGYLGSLDDRILTPRLPSPRTEVPAGSVAIADAQSAVYPAASPGGWNILGRTPLRLFDLGREEPSLLRPGMRVRFEPIEKERFLELGGER